VATLELKEFGCLKGLSHEIDQKNVDLNLKNLAQLRDATGFEFFRGSNDFIVQKV